MKRVPHGVYPVNDFPAYRSSEKRAPHNPAIEIPHTASELTGPGFGGDRLRTSAEDLTLQVPGGTAQGQRIIVSGRVSDERGRPERGALIEVWQANAAARYRHERDTHDAPLDPYFLGGGQVVTDDDGHYKFTTIEPGLSVAEPLQRVAAKTHSFFSIRICVGDTARDPDVFPR